MSPGALGMASMDIRGIMAESRVEMSLKYCFIVGYIYRDIRK